MNTKPLVLKGEDGDCLEMRYSNRGEPYRQGAEIEWRLVRDDWTEKDVTVFLKTHELRELRDKLNELLGDS